MVRSNVVAAVALGLSLAVLTSGCVGAPDASPSSSPPTLPTATASAATQAASLWRPSADATTVAEGLDAPWSVVPLGKTAGGGALISERDSGRVLELTDGTLREVGTVPGVVAGGEGGLNGVAVWDGGAAGQDDAASADCRDDGAAADHPVMLYAYHRATSGNQVVRIPLRGGVGEFTLGEPELVLEGIEAAGNHNGGRIAFGPDGCLYVATGDAGQRDLAQLTTSLNGKILRITPEGEPAAGNPWGNAVWSIGHRNVEGLAWTPDGTMWASEFGENTWDELNRIEAGMNYGWPLVEGRAGDGRFVDPVLQWEPRAASPSGLAAVGDTLFMAGLRGRALWIIDTDGGHVVGEASTWLPAHPARLRDAVAAPDGSLWVLSNNTDGRGDPAAGDDRLIRVPLVPAP